MLQGTFVAKKKDGTVYYRSSINHKGKHISLGSFETEQQAHEAYLEAQKILLGDAPGIAAYGNETVISFEKWVVLHNFRQNGIYIKTPVYLQKKYFDYYYAKDCVYKFDVDDLFYYSTHKIMKRGGHLFVADFGMQENILARYGIKNYAVAGKDYVFANGDNMDYRYANIQIVNRYHGVRQWEKKGRIHYETHIHLNGFVLVGRYDSENEAAAAYNKAAKFLWELGVTRQFPLNYILELESEDYLKLYEGVKIAKDALEKGAESFKNMPENG